jgi:hypothetical protein
MIPRIIFKIVLGIGIGKVTLSLPRPIPGFPRSAVLSF